MFPQLLFDGLEVPDDSFRRSIRSERCNGVQKISLRFVVARLRAIYRGETDARKKFAQLLRGGPEIPLRLNV
jgi:hypothetical protein